MRLSFLAVLIALVASGQSFAAVLVIGDPAASQCSKAAFNGQADTGALEQCAKALNSGLLLSRDQAATYVNRGVLLMIRTDYADARLDFESAIRTDPAMGEAYVNRGAVDIVEKRDRDGIADIDKGLALGAGEPAKAYYNRAIADEDLGDETSAYFDYQKATTLAPRWDLPRLELLQFTVTRR